VTFDRPGFATFPRPGIEPGGAQVPAPRVGITAAGGLGALALAWYTFQRYGADRAALFAVGGALGVTLYHARFGFTSAWRQPVSVGQGRGLQAQTLAGIAMGYDATSPAPARAHGRGS
jgi:hypothetical protein